MNECWKQELKWSSPST